MAETAVSSSASVVQPVNPETSLIPFDSGPALDFIERGDEILFTAEEIGKHLGYAEPAKSISNLYNRNKSELKHYSSVIKLVNEEGFQRDTRVFSEEGVYILSMRANTNEAKRFRARVALLLRRVRREREERMIELARQAGFEAARELLGPETETAAFENGVSAVLGLTDGQLAIAKAVRRYHKAGLSTKESARLLGVSPDQVRRTLRGLEVWS